MHKHKKRKIMKNSQIEKTGDGYIVYRQNVEGQEERIAVQEIRAAIVAPDRTTDPPMPGYYLLLGKLKGEDSDDMPELVFVTEAEEASPKALFQKLVVDEEENRFNTLYTEPYRFSDVPDFIHDLHSYLNEKNIRWVRIVQTLHLYGDDPGQGVNIIGQWAGRINIPEETTVRYQLREKVGPKNFKDPTLYAFTALRYLIAGFKLDKSSFIDEVKKRRAKAKKIEVRKNLDSASRFAANEFGYICRRLKEEDDWEDDWEDGF